MKLHRRSTHEFQVKEITEAGEFSGYGSVFNVKDSYGDIVIKGAFAKSLEDWKAKGKMPKMLWQHDSREPIGVWTSMKEDDKGLYVEGRILRDAGDLEKRAYAHLKAGSVDSLSIGYSLSPEGVEYNQEEDAYLLKQINLWEVSPVTFPANPDALIDTVKSAITNGPKEFERFLRDAGLSRSQAKGLMAFGYDGLREADDGQKQDESLEKLLNNLRALRG